jgi:translation initiation factor IF-2
LKNAESCVSSTSIGFSCQSSLKFSKPKAEAEKIIANVKSGTHATETAPTSAPEKAAQPKAKASKKREDSPRTFAGKAIVEDPAILARYQSKRRS